MRVTTAFNRLLALPGARVIDMALAPEGVVVGVALRRRRAACSACGQIYRGAHDAAVRRWRHLDVGGQRCLVEYRLRRVACRDCGVRVEAVPWARTGARHTRDFEDLSPSWRSRWPRRRSAGSCASVGTPSGRSSRAWSPTGSTSGALPGWSPSVWTRSPTGAGSATSRSSAITPQARSCGADRAATPTRCRRSLTSWATAGAPSGRSRSP